MNPLLVVPHMGLGDQLVCNGLVRRLAADGRQVVVVCKTSSAVSVKFMYRDLDNVHALPVENDDVISPRFGADGALLRAFANGRTDVLLLGLHRGPLPPGSGFADAFYRQAHMPPSFRYSCFRVTRDRPGETQRSGRYVFVHDDADRGFHIQPVTDLPVVRPGKADHRPGSNNIFTYVGLMERAAEIRVIDSCFAHLADLLDLCPGRRFLHADVKNPEDRCEDLFLRPGWQFVRG